MKPPSFILRAVLGAAAVPVVATGLRAGFALASRWVEFGTGWPLWGIALTGAAATVAIVLLYDLGWGRPLPLLLRLAALALCLWVVLQPARVERSTSSTRRTVAVLVDDSISMDLRDHPSEATRAEQVRSLLADGVLERLGARYNLRLLRFGNAPVTTAPAPWLDGAVEPLPDSVRGGTDLAGALEHVLAQVPREELAGALVLSDGRHNGPDPAALATRLAPAGEEADTAPVSSVLIGSRTGQVDAAILRVEFPETVHEGDAVQIRAHLRFSRLEGRTMTVRLLADDTEVETRSVRIPDARTMLPVAFRHKPDELGTVRYRVEIEPVRGEAVAENNRRRFDVSVTDARMRILLVEDRARWEFRYLRNLLDGRDATVRLQYVLLRPDRVQGQRAAPAVAASVDRPPGEAEATRLPAGEEGWMRFDAVLIGDVPPGSIDAATWDILHRAVTRRGVFLALLAGPNHMPGRHDHPRLRELSPVVPGPVPEPRSPAPPFLFTPTPTGARHPVLRLAEEEDENERVWRSFPFLHWRAGGFVAKPGAETLAEARAEDGARAPVLVVQQVGRGKVATLLTDRTWRFRYRVGDRWHHAFWGQLLRWGVGERLRDGNDALRLGTDRLAYRPGGEVELRAEVTGPEPPASVEAELRREGDAGVVARVPMPPEEAGAVGRYAGRLVAPEAAGVYRLRVRVGAVEAETGFVVEAGDVSVELAEIDADPAVLAMLAAASGGTVCGPAEIGNALARLRDPRIHREETRTRRLWDRLPVFLLFLGLVATEWVVRRTRGRP